MDWIRARVRRKAGDPAPVFYDGACEACNRGGMLIRAMDILGRFRTVDFRSAADRASAPEFGEELLPRAEREMLIRRKDGSWVGGFEAFRTLAWGLPLLWPFAPLLYLPGIKPLGTAAYSWISRNRFRFLGVRCVSGSCSS
jgi:predicted DCC family thiol-disulfide oxidoreductase YuxK